MEFLFGIAMSIHLGLDNDYNQMHPYFRAEYEEMFAGVYYNSLEKTSLYIGTERELGSDISVELGVVSGYKKDPIDIIPMVRLKYKQWFVMPAIEDENKGAVIGYEFKF
jgi:hypothetical protein